MSPSVGGGARSRRARIGMATLLVAVVAPGGFLFAPRAAAGVRVSLVQPAPGTPLFGEMEMVAEVPSGEDVARVEFFVDQELVGSLEEPPFSVMVDFGQENRPHHLLVRAYDSSGDSSEVWFESPAIEVHDQIEARLQQLYVTVLDGDQRVLDLKQQDFEIFDSGVRQQPVTFSRGEVPLAAVVLVDASSSMAGRRLLFALRGAASFAERMRPDDETSIQLFSDRLLFSSPFSGDAAAATEGLAEVRAAGGTALNDYLYRALKQLESRQGRRVVVFLSDGIDSHSTLRMTDLTWLARRSRAMLYWINIDPIDSTKFRYSSWKDPDLYRRDYRALGEIVEETGGRIIPLERIEDAESAIDEILDELREQYVIGYYPSTGNRSGSWHKVDVRLARPGFEVRARDGYIDY